MLLRAFGCLAFVFYVGGIAGAQQPSLVPVTHISLPDPAYIGMPIWMTVKSASGYLIHYPSSTTPNDFDCDEVEVERDGQPSRPFVGYPPAGRVGALCGWLGIAGITESRLPIHLQHPLTEPGTYNVRFRRRAYQNG